MIFIFFLNYVHSAERCHTLWNEAIVLYLLAAVSWHIVHKTVTWYFNHLQSQLKTISKDIKIYIECKIPVWLCFDPHKWCTNTGYALTPLILHIYSINVFKMKQTPRIPDRIHNKPSAVEEKKNQKRYTCQTDT